jgi:predicted component of type VI protein secretion system
VSGKADKSIKSAKLVWQDEGGGIREYFLNENTSTFIGRDTNNDIVFPEREISNQHATIYWKDESFEIVDQGSSNGTYVNSRKITDPRPLQDEDRIEIGEHLLSYYFLGERLIEEFKTMRLTDSTFQEAAEAALQPTQIQEEVEHPKTPTMPEAVETAVGETAQVAIPALESQDMFEEQETIIYEGAGEVETTAEAASEARVEEAEEIQEIPEETPEKASEVIPEPTTGGFANLEIDFNALMSQLQSALGEAQSLDEKGRATNAKLVTFLERQGASIEELDAVVQKMDELNGQAAESGIVTLLEKLSKDSRNVLLLAELAAYTQLLASLIKDYTALGKAIGKTREKMRNEIADFVR